ncbi:MAG: hypothetical protein KA165_13355 [Saprospiraceae bacterium]|nr:hypothetical protein [Saprospiraceae bacterium]
MKLFCILLFCGMAFCLPVKNKSLTVEPEVIVPPSYGTSAGEAAAAKTDSVHFATQIQPILQSHCNPCHFPGGKMYEKMPFDQGKTVVGHLEGMLRRIKDEGEVSLLKRYVAEQAGH